MAQQVFPGQRYVAQNGTYFKVTKVVLDQWIGDYAVTVRGTDKNGEPLADGAWFRQQQILETCTLATVNTTFCPECGSENISNPEDDRDGWIDCFDCGIFFDPAHPNNQTRPQVEVSA